MRFAIFFTAPAGDALPTGRGAALEIHAGTFAARWQAAKRQASDGTSRDVNDELGTTNGHRTSLHVRRYALLAQRACALTICRMIVKDAEEQEVDQLARIWHEGWHDAHAHLMPPALTRLRTLDSFAQRLSAALPTVRVVHRSNAPAGFCMLKDDELYQLYVAAEARGSGAAAALVADAEARLAERGVTTAWLGCAIGNDRAARFYEKCGWHRARTEPYHAEIPEGVFTLDVWCYEKSLR